MVAGELGERLQSSLNLASLGSGVAAVFYGGALVMLVGLLPGVGQLVQALLLVVGLGTAVSVLLSRPPHTEAPADTSTSP